MSAYLKAKAIPESAIVEDNKGVNTRATVRSPQTNGMVERFNGRISEVLRSHHFRDSEDLAATLTRYVYVYNEPFPQRALGAVTSIQAMEEWYEKRPELSKFKSCNHTGPDNST